MRINKTLVPKNGQIASLDLSIAFIVILTIITYTLIHHHTLINNSIQGEQKIEDQKTLYEASESLLTTPGKPLNWEEETKNIKRIGTAKYEENTVKNHDLDSAKIKKLKQIPLNELKKGLGLENQKINIELKHINGEKILQRGTLNKRKTTQITRITNYQGDLHVLKIQIQRK